jgi:hypothetical protein
MDSEAFTGEGMRVIRDKRPAGEGCFYAYRQPDAAGNIPPLPEWEDDSSLFLLAEALPPGVNRRSAKEVLVICRLSEVSPCPEEGPPGMHPDSV